MQCVCVCVCFQDSWVSQAGRTQTNKVKSIKEYVRAQDLLLPLIFWPPSGSQSQLGHFIVFKC